MSARAPCHNAAVVLLVSTYDLGRQPFGLASAAAALRASGFEVECADLSRTTLADESIRRADAVAFFLPMHTATRLAMPVIDRVRAINPEARLAGYGLYAPLNAALLREHGVSIIEGGEFEDGLVAALGNLSPGFRRQADADPPVDRPLVPRVRFRLPDRSGLPALTRYATLQLGDERRTVGYTEATRGCKHRCRHCPIVPVYDGRFRVVPIDIVMADIRAQVAAGAQHITFGDPDFLNGIGHALALIDRFAAECPGVSYDVTIKVEHLLRHADALPRLRDTGCAFVTTAVESVDDRVLARLEKGHTRADVERVVALARAAALPLAPTFVAFTPWTTLAGYCDLVQTIDRLGLVDHVAPIQLAIRLLVTEGSRLLELPEIHAAVGPFNPRTLTYPWTNADPAVDELQRAIEAHVGVTLSAPRRRVFARIWEMAHGAAGLTARALAGIDIPARATIPYLNEPWYC
jgi:radical SAM superfamily enzyme YgiQ (UPF0313 family)